jgi:hypothetical protein
MARTKAAILNISMERRREVLKLIRRGGLPFHMMRSLRRLGADSSRIEMVLNDTVI